MKYTIDVYDESALELGHPLDTQSFDSSEKFLEWFEKVIYAQSGEMCYIVNQNNGA